MKIHVLDHSVANLIAAGEVVERPASVVKELVENAIDAGAHAIKIEIAGGGRDLIRITDDGCGMSDEDARLCFKKHATSKILQKEDLFCISTLGFRGEALAAISAVSEIDLTTKQAGALSGRKYHVVAGAVESCEEVGCTDGTTFSVQNLFYNTPARLKFLKAEQTEAGHITALVHRLALSHPDISFSYFISGREQLFTMGNGQLRDVIFAVYGKSFTEGLLQVDYQTEGYRIYGYVGSPLFNKPNRNWQLFYVNHRVVKSKVLQNTLENAFRNSMLVSRYPVCVLFLEMSLQSVDVNVHPSKVEVKFADDKAVSAALRDALHAALSYDRGITEISLPKLPDEHPANQYKDVKLPFEEKMERVVAAVQKVAEPVRPTQTKYFADWTIRTPGSAEQLAQKEYSPLSKVADAFEPVSLTVADSVPAEPLPFEEQNGRVIKVDEKADRDASVHERVEPAAVEPLSISEETAVDFSIIGEAFHSYIIVEKGEDLLFIDKHALHERMLFEKLKTEKIEVQYLLSPILLDLGASENQALLSHREDLLNAGFETDDFGDSVIVRSIPQILENKDVESVLADYANNCLNLKTDKNELADEFLHTVACKAAVKSGMNTSRYELEDLIQKYFANESQLKYCPHGRPITFSLSRKSIEKQFKRIL